MTPGRSLDDARDYVERKNPLGPRLFVVDVEGDPHLQQHPRGFGAQRLQVARAHLGQAVGKRQVSRTGLAVAIEHLIEEGAGGGFLMPPVCRENGHRVAQCRG